jgi:molecular chaperone GrpE
MKDHKHHNHGKKEEGQHTTADAEQPEVAPTAEETRSAEDSLLRPDTKGIGTTQAKEEKPSAEVELAALKDRFLRLQADMDNLRKRTLKEKTETYLRANEDILMELIPVLDHLDLALNAAGAGAVPATHGAVVDGFKLVAEQLMAALMKFGLEPIDAQGQMFDVNKHEAISQMPSETVPEGVVITQTRRGYMLGDKLLRPAQVVVSAGKAEDEPRIGRVTASHAVLRGQMNADGKLKM